MVDPAGIPQFTGNLEQLAKDASGLRSAATGIRSGGADVHSRFQMLGAYYIAPEAEDLFSTTEPVMDKADTFAADLETVADALDTFASEVRPLAAKLVSLQEDARKFVASVEGDDDWTDDGDKTARNNELVADVTATRAAFEAAERRAASKISALVGGPRFIEDDGSHKATEQTVMYGYDADLLKQAKDLPWGSPVSQTRPDNLGGHLTSFFYDGFVMNGAVASVKGLGTLVGIGGSAKDAWKGLYDVSAGAGHYLMKPTDWVLDQTMFATEDTADMKRQKTAFREFGKAFVAWDQWEEHPVQAAGTVTFNALTLAAGPLGAVAKGGSAAGKVGLGAKAAGIGAKIGTYADPFSAALTVGGKAVGKVPTIAELTSRLTTKAETTPEIQGVHSVLEVGGHKVLVKDGQFLPLNAEGKPVKDTAPSETTIARGEAPESPVLVGAGSRVPGVVAQADGHIPPQAGHEPTADRTGAGSTRSSGGANGGKSASPATPLGAGHSAAPQTGASAGDSLPSPSGKRGHSGSAPNGASGTGTSPHKPKGSSWYEGLSPQQIADVQVYRANHEPGYRERYYQKNGYRHRETTPDESGFAPPQLVEDPSNPGIWIAASDKNAPFPEKYVPSSKVVQDADTVPNPYDFDVISGKARQRYASVIADTPWHEPVAAAKAAYETHSTPGNLQAYNEIKAEHAPFHEAMSKDSEAFGEAVARHHVIPTHYFGAKMEPLRGPANGNDQFDQVWSWTGKDGRKRFVVIESKSTINTKLGKRTLPNGFDARQGSKEYFLDILRKMKERGMGDGIKSEEILYEELREAYKRGNVDYILVKGKVTSTGDYDGYQKWTFDIGP